jgi:beta-glucosidase
VTRPVEELKGFVRVALHPKEEQRVRLEVPVRDIGFSGLDMKYVVEQDAFKVWTAPDSRQGLEGEFEVQL